MVRGPYLDGRLIAAAKVVGALDRFDLALVLWAVSTKGRARVLAALVDGPATAQQIRRQTGITEASLYRALEDLVEARLVVTGEKVQGSYGPRAWLYKISSGRRPNEP